MIPDDAERDPVIDFSWFYFIGRTKLGLTLRETGRITLTLFNKLYMHYRNSFDYELMLQKLGKTYAEADQAANDAEEWF